MRRLGPSGLPWFTDLSASGHPGAPADRLEQKKRPHLIDFMVLANWPDPCHGRGGIHQDEKTMDRILSTAERRQGQRRRVLLLSGSLLLLVLLWLGLGRLLRPGLSAGELRFSTATIGGLEATLSADGLVRPAFEDVRTSPVEARIERLVAPAGALLAEGDTILVLDRREIRERLERVTDRIALKEAELRKARADQVRQREELANEVEILAERISFLEAKREQEAQLFERRLTTVWNLRQAERDENIARLEHKGLLERIRRLDEGSAAGDEALRIELRLLEGERRQVVRELDEAVLRAPRPCVLSWVPEEEGRLVTQGEVLARLADRDAWKIEASLSDIHAARLLEGLPARVRLDGKKLTGRVERIHPRVVSGRITFDLRLDEPRNPELRSNRRVDVEVVLEERTNTLVVERGPGFGTAGLQEAFVVEGNRLVRRSLRCGLGNRDKVEVLEGLQPGERVVISAMERWHHLEKITLKGN